MGYIENMNNKEQTKQTVLTVAQLLDEKKAFDIVIIDVEVISGFTDYFIIASCNSIVQLNSLEKHIREKLDEADVFPINSRTRGESPWNVIDYNDFIVHLFLDETRKFYDIEKIWYEGEIVKFESK